MEMVKECEKLYTWAKKLLKKAQNSMRTMPTKHKNMWNLKLGNMCG
jgi:hypothetical protein